MFPVQTVTYDPGRSARDARAGEGVALAENLMVLPVRFDKLTLRGSARILSKPASSFEARFARTSG
jgi:hypothetical protein